MRQASQGLSPAVGVAQMCLAQADALLDLVFAQGGGHASCCRAGLLVVAPETQHLHDLLLLQHLIHEAVLDVDAP